MSLIFVRPRLVSPELPLCFHHRICGVVFLITLPVFAKCDDDMYIEWFSGPLSSRNTSLSMSMTISSPFWKSFHSSVVSITSRMGRGSPCPHVQLSPLRPSHWVFWFSKYSTFSYNAMPSHILFAQKPLLYEINLDNLELDSLVHSVLNFVIAHTMFIEITHPPT